MPTREQVIDDICAVLARGDEALRGLPVPLVSTSIGSTTTIVDTKLGRGTSRSGKYDSRIVEITELVGAGPAVGEVAGVDDAGFASDTTVTVSPAFTATPQSGTNYRLWALGYSPEEARDKLNEVLRQTDTFHLYAPSLIYDSDFGENDVANLPGVGSPTTRAFVTTAANVLFGARALNIITDATGEGAETSTTAGELANVHEGEQLLVSTNVSVTGGDMEVVMYNYTASSNVKRVRNLDEPAWTEVRFWETVPGNMEQLTLRWLSDSVAASTFYVSPHIIVQSQWRRAYTLPSWFTREGQLVDALYLPQGENSEDADSYVSLSATLRAVMGLDFIRSDRDANPMRVEFRVPSGGPVYLKVKRPFATASADSTELIADRDYLVASVLTLLYRDRGDAAYRYWDGIARERAQIMGYGGRDLRIEENPTVLL